MSEQFNSTLYQFSEVWLGVQMIPRVLMTPASRQFAISGPRIAIETIFSMLTLLDIIREPGVGLQI